MLNKSLSASSDFLKGLAMISLVYVHYVRLEYGLIDNIMWIWDPQVLHKIVTEAAQYSWWSVLLRYFAQVAVTMFFILSSWGLSYSLLARNKMPPPWLAFMHGRVRKLAPLYWIALFVMMLAALAEYHDSGLKIVKILVSFGLKASFLHIFHPDAMFNYNSALWFFGSLMFLYMLFPALYRATLVRPWATLGASIAIGYLSTVLIKATPLYAWHPALAMGGFPLARLGDFAFGIFLAVHSQQCTARGKADAFERHGYSIGFAALIVGVVSMLGFRALGIESLGFLDEWIHPLHVFGLGIFAVLAGAKFHDALLRRPRLFGAPVKAVAFVGIYSYSMFLFHMPLIRPWLAYVSDRHHIFVFGTLFLVTMFFVFYAIEKFSNRYLVPPIQAGIDSVFAGLSRPARTVGG